MILVYIPCKDEGEARKISKHLLDNKLVACAGMWPIKSLYNWKGKLADESEVTIFAKSKKELAQKIIDEVTKIHSYEIPCIEIIESKANKEYEDWVEGELKQ